MPGGFLLFKENKGNMDFVKIKMKHEVSIYISCGYYIINGDG